MTMYHNKLAAAIKVNGKVLREYDTGNKTKDSVYIPFGSEYSIYLKNINTVRAIVNVFIDGENIVPGGLQLNVGQECNLERSIKNGNLNVGNKLKFIERTGKIEDHRGIKLEDGLVRIEYQFEKVYNLNNLINTYPYPVYSPTPFFGGVVTQNAMNSPTIGATLTGSSGVLRSASTTGSINNVATASCSNAVDTSYQMASLSEMSAPQNETGITVAGSKSDQQFVTGSWFALEHEIHSMIFKLLGETPENKAVREPMTVKAKPICPSCGRHNKANAKFCSEDGTALVLFA